MEKEINAPVENRGGKNKRYDILDMTISEVRSFENTTTGKVLTSAKQLCKRHNLEWRFRCWTTDGVTYIMRII